MVNISLCIVVRNERNKLPDFFNRILKYITEVVIVDQKSNDGTLEYLVNFKYTSKAGNRFTIIVDRQSHAAWSRREALERANYDWRLILDADEYLEDPTCLQRLASSNRSNLYAFRRKNYVDGKFMDFLYPDHQPRFMHKSVKHPINPTLHETVYSPNRIDVDDHIIHHRTMNAIRESQAYYKTFPGVDITAHDTFLANCEALVNDTSK